MPASIINLGAGTHTPTSAWNNALVVFNLTNGHATVTLPKADTLPELFEFSFQLKSVGSYTVEFKTTDQGDVLNGHWRTHHPTFSGDTHTGWGDAQAYGLFASLTQTSGKVWKCSETEYGFCKTRGIVADPMSQDTVTVDCGGVWAVTPRSSGETIVVTNAAQGSTPASDIFLDFGNLKDWCPAHIVPGWNHGNYLYHVVTIQKVDDSKVNNVGRVVGIGSFHSAGYRVTPNNDPSITGLDRGYFYLTKPSTVRVKVTQSSMEILDYWEMSHIPTART